MADDVIGLDVVAKLDKLEDDLGRIPGIAADEARAMTAALAKEIKRVENAARAASKATATTAKAAAAAAKTAQAEAAQRMSDVQRGAEKIVGGIVGDISDVSTALGSLGAGGAAIAAAALVTVGGAIGAIGASVDAIRTIEDTRARLTELGAASTLTASQLQQIEGASRSLDSLEVASLRAQEALAATSSRGVDLLATQLLGLVDGPLTTAAETTGRWVTALGYGITVVGGFTSALADQYDSIEELAAAIHYGPLDAIPKLSTAWDEAIPRAVANVQASKEVAAAYGEVDVAAERAAKSTADLANESKTAAQARKEELQMLIALGVVEDSKLVEDERAKAAAEAKARAAREAAAAEREAAQASQAYAQLTGAVTQGQIALADPMHKVTLQLAEQIAEYDRLLMAAGGTEAAVEAAEAAKVQAVTLAEQQIQALRDQGAKQTADRAAEELARVQADAAAHAQAWQDAAATTVSAVANIGTTAADAAAAAAAATLAALEASGDATAAELAAARDAAEARAKFAKGAAVLETTVNAAAAITKAATAAPPPFNAPGIVAMSALAAAQIAAATAAPLPTFHAGGLVRGGGPAPDERRRSLVRRDRN